MGRLFGTNGVRGHVGTTMTPELALRVGQAVGTWLSPGDRIALGTDARASRDMLKAALAAGLQSTGVHVVDVGILPSPGIQLYVRDKGFAAGAMVTASHNPPEDNGIKLVAPDGTETSPAEEDEVERHYFSGRFRTVSWDKVGMAERADDAAEHYIQAVLRQVDAARIRKARLTAVLDPGGGAGCVAAPALLERLGVKAIKLACDLDPTFSSRPSEPTPDNAAACRAAVRRHKADLGILQDGDADRAVFVDGSGAYLWGDVTLALASKHELARHPKGSIVCTAVSSSSCVADAVRDAGGRLEWTVVGSPIVAREMIRVGAVFGGEENGGLMFARHQICRDGLMAMAFMLELLATTGKPLAQLAATIERYSLVKRKVGVPDAKKAPALAKLRTAVARENGVRDVDLRDGVKAYLPEGWALVRASGTEPAIRIMAEARTDAKATAIADRFQAMLEAAMRDAPGRSPPRARASPAPRKGTAPRRRQTAVPGKRTRQRR